MEQTVGDYHENGLAVASDKSCFHYLVAHIGVVVLLLHGRKIFRVDQIHRLLRRKFKNFREVLPDALLELTDQPVDDAGREVLLDSDSFGIGALRIDARAEGGGTITAPETTNLQRTPIAPELATSYHNRKQQQPRQLPPRTFLPLREQLAVHFPQEPPYRSGNSWPSTPPKNPPTAPETAGRPRICRSPW